MTKTAFDRMREEKMQDPEWAAGYERALTRINQTHRVLQALDEAREARGLSKAELARRIGAEPSVVRRLFSADGYNPTLTRVVDIATELGYKVSLTPSDSPGQ